MDNFLTGFGAFIAFISFFTFIIGFFMLFDESKRKLGLKFMIFSLIAFIIGFSTCIGQF
ncbi:hypothetical protein [Flavobacterium sp.]|uniref:hypothetical protein n=1 Tax=Flavobacterium sp. TaxID=239 RepID=UPI0037505FD8